MKCGFFLLSNKIHVRKFILKLSSLSFFIKETSLRSHAAEFCRVFIVSHIALSYVLLIFFKLSILQTLRILR